jgi:hypothetical protein
VKKPRISLERPLRRLKHRWKYSNIDRGEAWHKNTDWIISIYACTALVGLGLFFSFLMYTQSVGLLGQVISRSQGRYLHTEQYKHRMNVHIHGVEPCLKWNSPPRPQCSSHEGSSCTKPRGHYDRHRTGVGWV